MVDQIPSGAPQWSRLSSTYGSPFHTSRFIEYEQHIQCVWKRTKSNSDRECKYIVKEKLPFC